MILQRQFELNDYVSFKLRRRLGGPREKSTTGTAVIWAITIIIGESFGSSTSDPLYELVLKKCCAEF